MSLRRLLTASAVALLGLALMTAIALVVITSRMRTNTSLMWHSMESVYTAEEIELTLLRHSRERRLYGFTGDERYAASMEREEDELQRLLVEAGRLVGSPEEAAVLGELGQQTTEYLERTATLMGQGAASIAGSPQILDEALPTAHRLVEINIADAERSLAGTRRWDEVANALGVGAAGLLLAGIFGSIWIVRRDVYQPLVAIREAIVRFQLGNAGVTAPESGARELREIAGEFNRMTRRLERQREIQLGFIAGVAHDLRNPLGVLKLSAALIRPDQPLPPEDKVRGRFVVVARQVVQIERMVEDLLDTARIEAGQLGLQLGVHDLATLVREAVALHDEVSAAHRLVFEPATGGPALVRCDSTRIAQVLNNLLSNAIKYSPGGGEVRLDLASTASGFEVSVTDSGMGIPAEELETIFEPFRRSSNTQGTIPGVGLGLAVARRILEAQGGAIAAESRLGQGTTFRVTLPRLDAGAAVAGPGTPADGPGGSERDAHAAR